MATINPYINFGGRARDALAFYQTIFGGETEIMSVKDSFLADKMPAESADLVFHSALSGGAFHLMASDMLSADNGLQLGNAIALAIVCDTDEQLQGYFDTLQANGKVVFPVAKSEWGSTYAQVIDQFGITWMLNQQH